MEICSNCHHVFDDVENTSKTGLNPCPECGSITRIVRLEIDNALQVQTVDTVTVIDIVNLAPLFSFGAIVKVERTVLDGQIITLVDPVYLYLINEIKKDADIIYRIGPREWEELIAAAYDKAGFDEVILTPRSGDLGRDVIAIKKGYWSVRFIDQVKAYNRGHLVTADEVRALLGVLQADQGATKAIFTTTSTFAPGIEKDRFIKPFIPYRLELIDKEKLLKRLIDINLFN